jgi:hypothetical protein
MYLADVNSARNYMEATKYSVRRIKPIVLLPKRKPSIAVGSKLQGDTTPVIFIYKLWDVDISFR